MTEFEGFWFVSGLSGKDRQQAKKGARIELNLTEFTLPTSFDSLLGLSS
jgi:hypothetical protein